MRATAGRGLRQPLPAQASPEQAAAQGVETVAAQPKVERVARAAAAMAVGQMETQVLPEQLTRAAAAALAGIKQVRITLAKQAALASSSSKCRIRLAQYFQAALHIA
jgi:hypothetical protein